jgi:hypothetical protein
MVDHSIYSWFGYVVIGGELLIAVTFITAIATVVYRSWLPVAAAGTVVALLFHFWFLMSGSAGVNALMPYLTAIAAVCLIGSWVGTTASEAPVEVVQSHPMSTLETMAVPTEKAPANGATREPIITR